MTTENINVAEEIAKISVENIEVYMKTVKNISDGLKARRDALETDLIYENSKAPFELSKLQSLRNSVSGRVENEIQPEIRELQDWKPDKLPEEVNEKLLKLNSLRGALVYVRGLLKLTDINVELKSALGAKQWSTLKSIYLELNNFCEAVQKSQCMNLVTYASDFRKKWRGHILEKCGASLSAALQTIGYPFDSIQAINYKSPVLKDVESLTSLVSMLDDSPKKTRFSSWILDPFSTRFRYHFYGDRKTNNPEKPEWFFTQLLDWLDAHKDFFHRIIVPNAQNSESIVDNMMETLVKLGVEKVEDIISVVQDNPAAFSHLIDETVLFEMEIRAMGYCESKKSCLEVFASRELLDLWIQLEKDYNTDKVDLLLLEPTAWMDRYKEAPELDAFKVPEVVDNFLLLLQLVTERYRILNSLVAKYKFLSLQLSLLDDFRVRILQIFRNIASPWEEPFLQIMNGVHFILHVLEEWNDLPFFIQLQGFRYSAIKGCDTNNDGKESEGVSRSHRGVFEGAFDHILSLYRNIWSIMQAQVCQVLVGEELSRKTGAYRNEKWYSLDRYGPLNSSLMKMKEISSELDVSPSLVPFLLRMRERLSLLRNSLSPSNFNALLRMICEDTAKLFIQDLIADTSFNQLGGCQMRHDVLSYLIPLLKSYGPFGLEGKMVELLESLEVLSLKAGDASLLLDSIRGNPGEEVMGLPTEFRINFLSRTQVESLLLQRTDLISSLPTSDAKRLK